MPEGLEIAAVPAREDPADAWIGAGASLDDAPEGARVGTASLRRRAQLLAARPDLRVEELHGNVDTRLRKLAEGDLDAIVLAAAGLRRLGREDEIAFAIPAEAMVPAAGQGALVLQVRSRRRGGDRGRGADRRRRRPARADRRARRRRPARGDLRDADRRPRRGRGRADRRSMPSSASPTAASGCATGSRARPPTRSPPASCSPSACSAPAPATSSTAPRDAA